MKRERQVELLMREIRELKSASQNTGKTELDEKILSLQTVLTEFQKLPAVLRNQTDETIRSAIRASIQNDFKIPLTEAVQGPIAKLNQVTEQARVILAAFVRKVRFHAWAWLFSIFMLGVLAGAFGLYSFERHGPVGTMHETTDAKQPMSVGTKPPELKGSPGHRGH